MASSSAYIQLSPSVLLEYIYTDPSNPEVLNTSQAPIYRMVNSHLGRDLFFNSDGSEDATGNVRDRSSAIIDERRSRFAHLNIDNLRAYNDEDPKLTDSPDLPVSFNATWGVEYDTVRLHLARGFNFEGGEGLYFEAKSGGPTTAS